MDIEKKAVQLSNLLYNRGLDKAHEKRMGMFRRAFIFRMELDANKERMGWYLHDFDKAGLGIMARLHESSFPEFGSENRVEFISVAVTF